MNKIRQPVKAEAAMGDQLRSVGVGVIGCGGFGLFALQQFAQLPGVRLVGMAGTYPEAARAATACLGLPDVGDVDALLRMPEVD
ncbi:MAG: Gfo/Idh/MocA family oxidoreductase, partial [Thermoguttaceae bacterium]